MTNCYTNKEKIIGVEIDQKTIRVGNLRVKINRRKNRDTKLKTVKFLRIHMNGNL